MPSPTRSPAHGMRRLIALLSVILIAAGPVRAAETPLNVAVASNFRTAMGALVASFEEKTGHTVNLAFGSSGKHYAQIRNGAPFDAFFAADTDRPVRLEAEEIALPGSRFTYALGRLVLWSPQPGYVDSAGAVLRNGKFRHLAIANPDLAPYGAAAREALQSLGLWKTLQSRLVRGENIGQAYQFVHSGNAELGFISQSLLAWPGHPARGSWMIVPQDLYAPIEQQAVLLRDSEVARALMAFVRSPEARALIEAYGYEAP